MDLQSFASIAEIVGGIGVLVSLIFLIVSIRQNTTSQRALAVDSLTAAITAINVPAIESPTVGAAVAKAVLDWGSASRDERIIAHYFLFSFFKLSENAWYLRQSNVLDEGQWLGWERSIRLYDHSAGIQSVWWPNRRNAYSVAVQQFLSETQPSDDIGSLADIFDNVASGAK